jgi:hypothetical protein
MRGEDKDYIVADGQCRILDGYADRLRGRLLRRAAPLLRRGNLLQQMVIRYRMSRFIRAQIGRQGRRLAPFEALYASHSQSPPVSRVLDAILGPLERSIEARRVRRSYTAPLVTGSGRDSMRCYSGGRSVDVGAELLTGDVERRIYASYPLVWRDTGEKLTEAEAAHVIDSVCRHFDRRKVKWAIFPSATISTRNT